MFEQSYVNQAPAEPIYEGDFLYHYEIPSWQLGTRIYQILGVSLFINLLILAIFAQTPVLTAKGCDGPLVGKVCQVLDTVYIGALLFGTEREYADVAYDPTRLSPDDDVTFVDVSNLEAKLDYPDSFVDMSTGQTVPMIGGQMPLESSVISPGYLAPGIPSNPTITTTPDLTNTPQVLPTPNPNAVEGTLPSFNDPNPTTPRNRRNPRINKTPNNTSVADTNTNANIGVNPTLPNANTAAQPDEAKADPNGIFINKRPLTDQAKQTLADIQAKKVNIDTSFKVVVEGTLGYGTDGKTVVLKYPHLIKDPNIKNDPTMEKFVSDWILRVGDSGWLAYIDRVDDKGKALTKKLQITVEHNSTDFVASLRSEMPTENQANSVSSGFSGFVNLGLIMTNGNEDEQNFLKSLKTSVQGNVLTLNFTMPSPQAMEMIRRKLADLEKSINQPNSTAVVGPSNNTAAK